MSNPVCVNPVSPTAQAEARISDLLRARFYLAVLSILMIVTAGCASVPTNYPRTASAAFSEHQTTVFGQKLAADAAQHPGESGFAIIR